LTIETVPHNAKVALDDALLPPDTRQLEMVKDYAVHMVWAAAPGYRAKSEWIRFDADSISVKIALDARVSRQRGDGGKDAFRRPLSDSPPPSDALPAPAASGASPPR
jgi:hypothetical protein